ncbi:MAG TPA: EamA family transporter RarD [Verrucomicrobiae bacterium]|nr:EamA family transporter RarD [Verrucomicrobiae bacterium]
MAQILDRPSVPPAVASGGRLGASRAGLAYALSAYAIWGFIPLYFRALSSVPPITILYHRIIWSAFFLAIVVSARAEWRYIVPALRSWRKVALLSAGALLIALNWLLFIYSVSTKQLLQASLGYFINPLLSIALGMLFLGERLRGWQWVAVLIAAGAVLNLAIRGAGFPWLALSLAGSFGFYGLVRKAVDINSLHGLMIESAILFPAAAVMLAFGPTASVPFRTLGVLSLSGVITAVPLLCFGAALRRLQLSTMGFLQYVGPTLQFLVATCLFREPLDRAKLGSFAICWLAIGVYVADSLWNRTPQPIGDELD